MVTHKTMTIFFLLVLLINVVAIVLGTSTSLFQIIISVSLAVLLLSGSVLITLGLKEDKIENSLILMIFGLIVYIMLFWFIIKYILQLY